MNKKKTEGRYLRDINPFQETESIVSLRVDHYDRICFSMACLLNHMRCYRDVNTQYDMPDDHTCTHCHKLRRSVNGLTGHFHSQHPKMSTAPGTLSMLGRTPGPLPVFKTI